MYKFLKLLKFLVQNKFGNKIWVSRDCYINCKTTVIILQFLSFCREKKNLSDKYFSRSYK